MSATAGGGTAVLEVTDSAKEDQVSVGANSSDPENDLR